MSTKPVVVPVVKQPSEAFTSPVGVVKPPIKVWTIPARDDWQQMDIEAAHHLIQQLLSCYQEGAGVINQRKYDQARADGTYKCMVCQRKKPVTIDNHPNFVWEDHRTDPQTRLITTRRICSQECYFRGANKGDLTNVGTAANVHK